MWPNNNAANREKAQNASELLIQVEYAHTHTTNEYVDVAAQIAMMKSCCCFFRGRICSG